MSIKIIIDLPPESKGRPQFTRYGHAYTPQKTRIYENAVKLIAKKNVKCPLDGALRLIITYYMPIPKSWRETKKRLAIEGLIRPTTKPDIDNLCKAMLDSLNGILYYDDKQIVSLIQNEWYDIVPRTEIEVERL